MIVKLELMEDLYLEELRDLYDAEKQLLRALPEMAGAASAEELRSALEEHAHETESQVNRLEQVFGDLGEPSQGRKCKAMAGLIEEAKDFIEEEAEPEIKDAGLITNVQKIEHYKIAGYGSVCAHAKALGLEDQAELLHATLAEEEETDERLNLLAETINRDAVGDEITHTGDGE
jgi:ferritin-like metal-binding protein YciE